MNFAWGKVLGTGRENKGRSPLLTLASIAKRSKLSHGKVLVSWGEDQKRKRSWVLSKGKKMSMNKNKQNKRQLTISKMVTPKE